MKATREVLRAALGGFIAHFGDGLPVYAVTLAYNPHHQGTAGRCYRITPDGECLPLRGSGVSARHGVNHVSGARHVPLEQVHRDLDRLHGRVDRALFGARFNLLPDAERTAFVGFVEHPGSNVHVHLSWRVPETRMTNFADVISTKWLATGPAATIDVQPVRDAGWGEYVVKNQHGAALDDALLFVASRAARA